MQEELDSIVCECRRKVTFLICEKTQSVPLTVWNRRLQKWGEKEYRFVFCSTALLNWWFVFLVCLHSYCEIHHEASRYFKITALFKNDNLYICNAYFVNRSANVLLSHFSPAIFCLLLLTADKQDDENQNLKSQLKDTEEERTRLQRKISVQQSQTEKYKMLSQEASKKCEGLQQEVVALGKVLQILVSFISQWGKSSD